MASFASGYQRSRRAGWNGRRGRTAAPPHRTGRADLPHPALGVPSFGSLHESRHRVFRDAVLDLQIEIYQRLDNWESAAMLAESPKKPPALPGTMRSAFAGVMRIRFSSVPFQAARRFVPRDRWSDAGNGGRVGGRKKPNASASSSPTPSSRPSTAE